MEIVSLSIFISFKILLLSNKDPDQRKSLVHSISHFSPVFSKV